MTSSVLPRTDEQKRRGPYENHILSALGEIEVARLLPGLERSAFPAKLVLNEAGRKLDHVYFPEGGIVSFTMELPRSGMVEFGVVGREGFSCLSALRNSSIAPVCAVVQVGAPTAFRVRPEELRAAMHESAAFRSLLFEFLLDFIVQTSFTAVSNARHTLAERLARWLLMCHDRLDSCDIPLTHEFMAIMLGAQRTSVTSTLHILEGLGAIRSRRGSVQVIDRSCLENAAGEAYHPSLRPRPKASGVSSGG